MGKATAAVRAALPSLTSARWVFSCVHNTPKSDTDYRIINVHEHSYALYIYIRTRVGQTDSESAQHLIRKNWDIFLVLLTGFEPLPIEPRHALGLHYY